MTAINLVSPPLGAQYPIRVMERAALDVAEPDRACSALAFGALLSSMLAVTCACGLQAAESRPPSAKTPSRTAVVGSSSQFYEVLGKRYYVRASSQGYRERGIASWYGRPFDGHPTSSGEMYDMNEMTAAHPTLPIPTWVEVANLKNGKRVVVKVNDRGPFVGKRLIDLSYGAATALDMVRDGTARVEVRALPGPPSAKAPVSRDHRGEGSTQTSQRRAASQKATASVSRAKLAPPSPANKGALQSPPLDPSRLFAEAGRFTRREEAVRLVDSLRAEGLANAFVVTEDRRRQSLHRVRVGPLADATEVERMNERLRALGAKRAHSVAMR